jgi:FeS assembly SUF system protein
MSNDLRKADHVADEQMIKNAVGEENYDELAEPSCIEAPDHPKWPVIKAAIKEIYDPEIPVNIYELGLIYKVEIKDIDADTIDVEVKMTLTSPGCPVAQEMPGWVQGAIFPVEGVRDVDVEIIWDPPWNPGMMSEAAKMQLNMFT